MQTTGHQLRQARLKQKLTLTKLSQTTKIPTHILKAIEKNQFHRLPPQTYVKGFIINYSKALGLNPQKTLAIFRRDYQIHQKNPLIPKGVSRSLNPSPLFSPASQKIIAIFVTVILIVAYLSVSLIKLYQPPKLTILKPQNGDQLQSPVLIKGKTNHDATLTLNGKTINLESDGSFITVYNSPSGTVELTFKATSRRKKSTTQTRHIIIAD